MGYSTPDLYYQPEQFGLEVVGVIGDPQASYSFDDLVVWNHAATKTLYWAEDVGCSCPSPFEDYTKLAMANAVPYDDTEKMDELETAIREHCNYTTLKDGDYGKSATDDEAIARVDLLQRIRDITQR
jgi:hypothetical protein